MGHPDRIRTLHIKISANDHHNHLPVAEPCFNPTEVEMSPWHDCRGSENLTPDLTSPARWGREVRLCDHAEIRDLF
jgi:hypothetical protein